MDETSLALEIEEVAANAWPASIVQHVDGWRLRATPGIEARRSNSVLTLGGGLGLGLDEKIAIAAEFYERHRLPVRFHVSPASVPAGLDEALAGTGFEIEAPVDLMVADVDAILGRSRPDGPPVTLRDEPDADWLAALNSVISRGDDATLRRLVLDRIAPPVRYAAMLDGGRTVAVGMSVIERGWLGIFSMATLPDARRRGAATAVLRTLAERGVADGASRAYLQTDRGNAASHSLYEGLGFTTAYGYHYRTKRGGTATTP